MSFRPVAMSSNYRFGDDYCTGCGASGDVRDLQRASCTRCRRPNCSRCANGRTDDDRRGLCTPCGKGAPERPYGAYVTFVFVDEDPAWLVRERERAGLAVARPREEHAS